MIAISLSFVLLLQEKQVTQIIAFKRTSINKDIANVNTNG
jgi:hypothetical protein